MSISPVSWTIGIVTRIATLVITLRAMTVRVFDCSRSTVFLTVLFIFYLEIVTMECTLYSMFTNAVKFCEKFYFNFVLRCLGFLAFIVCFSYHKKCLQNYSV